MEWQSELIYLLQEVNSTDIKYLVDASLDTVTFYGDAEPTEPQACSKVEKEPQEDIGLQNSHNPKIWKKIDEPDFKG